MKAVKIQVMPEGRPDMWIPDKKSLKAFVKAKNFKQIHNFKPTGRIMVGADHDVKSVLEDIDRAERLALFTDPSANMGHSLAVIYKNELSCFDIGKLTEADLILSKEI